MVICFIFANSSDPDEMPHFIRVFTGLHVFRKKMLWYTFGISVEWRCFCDDFIWSCIYETDFMFVLTKGVIKTKEKKNIIDINVSLFYMYTCL